MRWRANSGSSHDGKTNIARKSMAGKTMTRKKKRLVLIGSALTLLGVAVALVLFALRDNIVFFYAPSEVVAKAVPPGTHMRIGGLVKQGSFTREDTHVHFVVTDGKNDIGVNYIGTLPDLFREGQGVVAEGTLGTAGLTASNVLAKHDERYMPREVVDALKKSGVWQEGQGMPAEPQAQSQTGAQAEAQAKNQAENIEPGARRP
jgi:cytochrome c-type biogenesis protein CcmE